MSNEASACIPAMAPRNASTDRAQREALTTFVGALLLGVTTRALLVGDPRGLHFLLWDVSVVAAMVFAFGRGRVAPSAWGALTACIGFGAATALRASPWAATIAVPWAFALCAVLPVLLLEPKRLEGLPSVLFASIARLRHAPDAFVETATLPIAASGGARRGPLLRALKGLAIGVPVASVFAVLLAGDPAFAGVLRRAFAHGNRTVSFAFGSLALAAAYAFVYRLHARPNATAAPSPPPQGATAYRDGGAFDPLEAIAPRARPSARSAAPRVTPTTWAWVLLPVTAMFALFVALNVRHLFRGHALVHDPLGPTYAAYLHAGFYQLLAATVLAVCLVLVGHLLLRPRSSEAHEPVAGGRALTAVECALVLLTTVTLVSCFDRLAIYEDAYGATYRRLGVAVIALSVLGVLALTLLKSIRRDWRGFGGAALALSTGVALAAAAFDADGYIAARNLDRAASGRPLDAWYLEHLSRDARPQLDHPYLRAPGRAELRARLAAAWGGVSP